MKLYSYFRSSASFRVRIALALKGLPYDYVPIHLVRGGGEQLSASYRQINPDALVPALEDGSNLLTQSLAIIEYLDETHPEPPLLPASAVDRAYVRSVALQVASEIHPVNNLRVLQYLKKRFGLSEDDKTEWYRHWIEVGFSSLENKLATDARVKSFVFEDTPTIADLCLVPQVWNARRFNISLDAYPTIVRLCSNAMEIEAFQSAEPLNQPDAES